MNFKKINHFLTVAAALSAAAMSACGDGGNGAGKQGDGDSLPAAATFEDSLSLRFGTQWGAQQATTLALLDDDKRSQFDVDAFIAGLRSAVMSDYSTAGMIDAIALGSDVAAQLDSYRAVGVNVRPGKLMEAFEAVFMADTLPEAEVNDYQAQFDEKMSVVQNLILEKMRQERRRQTIMSEKMRKENVEKAKLFVEDLLKSDQSVVKSPSGLLYKLNNAGAEPKATDGTTASVIYTIKGLDGRVIDSSRGESIDVPVNEDLIAGLKEGFSMLGAGGKAVFYIPSSLGFGRDNSGVEPGEMIIVEVEMKGVRK